MIPWL